METYSPEEETLVVPEEELLAEDALSSAASKDKKPVIGKDGDWEAPREARDWATEQEAQ